VTDPMTPLDLHAAMLVLTLLLCTAAAYAVRLAVSGPARFARVDAAGSSPLLGKRVMQMGYWGLQPLARACIRAGLSADRITALSLGLGAAAGVALALGHLGIGGALATVSSLGDALDGLVARATGAATRRGALFDAAVDRYAEFFFLGGLALHHHDDRARLALVLLAILGSFMVSYGSAKAEAFGVQAPRGAMRRAERAAPLCGGALLSPLAGALADHAALGPWLAEAPMLGALAIVGAVSNVSAVRRLGAVGRAAAAAPAPTRTSSAPAVVALTGTPRPSGASRSAPGLAPP
jgi:CDP-diacylglycerol---glycerol-3-phosphate 3-phosphatidyltransferase